VVGLRLEHELVIALATRMNVIESEHDDALSNGNSVPASAPNAESIMARGATHLVVGDYVRERDVLQVNLRLVDAESRLIIAAARGAVRLGGVGTPAASFDRWAWEPEESDALPVTTTTPPRVNVKPTVRNSPATTTKTTTKLDLASHSPAPAAAAGEPANAAAAAGAPAAQAAQSAPLQTAPPQSAIPISASKPIEDFESWRKRHQEEAQAAGKTKEELDQAAKSSTAGMVRAMRHELADLDQEASDPFPWRRYPWLAQLLGVPEGQPVR